MANEIKGITTILILSLLLLSLLFVSIPVNISCLMEPQTRLPAYASFIKETFWHKLFFSELDIIIIIMLSGSVSGRWAARKPIAKSLNISLIVYSSLLSIIIWIVIPMIYFGLGWLFSPQAFR